MFHKATLLALVLGLSVALAGCTNGDDPGTDGTTPGSTTPGATTPATTPTVTTPVTTTPPVDGNETPDLELNASGVPELVIVGQPFTFNLTVTGEGNWTSDHVGGHFGPNSTETPSVPAYPKACLHQEGAVPGEFTVECTASEAGTFFLRGHVRLNVSGELHNFWSDEHTIVARAPVGEYDLAVSGMPTLPLTAGQTFTFTLTVTGDAEDASDHIGGHFGANSTEEPSVAAYPFACVHQAGTVPGEFEVECTVPSGTGPGTHYLRGHVRIALGDELHNFWSDEVSFLVA